MAVVVVVRAVCTADEERVAEGALETVGASSFWGSAWKRKESFTSLGDRAEMTGAYAGYVSTDMSSSLGLCCLCIPCGQQCMEHLNKAYNVFEIDASSEN